MAIREILLLGNPKLYEICPPVEFHEMENLQQQFQDLQDTFLDFRKRQSFGRAIAAPQIGFMKRVVYMQIDQPIFMINPVLSEKSEELIELWDDCMSFPDLLVKVKRHKSCKITFQDLQWQTHTMELQDDLSELLQHECDHLDGILAVMLAIDKQSFALSSQRHMV